MMLLCILALLIQRCQCRDKSLHLEQYHDPYRFTTPRPRVTHGGVPMPDYVEAPDFRMPEELNLAHTPYYYDEEHRPYRLSPHYKMTRYWNKYNPDDDITYAACYCTTVYKRLTPLAGCALITTRHILTTATSTYLVLRDRKRYGVLENILGAWYDSNSNNYNSSLYLSPARIHFHPLWHYPEQVNRSHPLSFSFDLAVWATTYKVYGWYFIGSSATVCMRATSTPREWRAPSAHGSSGHALYLVVGFQFMLAYRRRPTPWHKYGVKTRWYTEPCPKMYGHRCMEEITTPLLQTEWGWFICISGYWAPLGVESGAVLHRIDKSWKQNGLIAMAAFSMHLRSLDITHYFTMIDTHPVLEFLYDAYESRLPYVWLDVRFEDSKRMAPIIKPGYYLNRNYPVGEQHEYAKDKKMFQN